MSNQRILWLKWLLSILAALPLLRLTAYFFTDRLGANPIEFITRSTGTWTFVYLLITLGVSLIRQWFNVPWVIRLRRLCGLWTFFYACLHFITYIWFDQFFDMNDIIKDVIKRPFITVGFAAFLLLIPLAVTSNKRAIRALGANRWQRLHWAIYLIAVLAELHYWWLVKRDVTQPLYFGLVLALLLVTRVIWKIKQYQQQSVANLSAQSTTKT